MLQYHREAPSLAAVKVHNNPVLGCAGFARQRFLMRYFTCLVQNRHCSAEANVLRSLLVRQSCERFTGHALQPRTSLALATTLLRPLRELARSCIHVVDELEVSWMIHANELSTTLNLH